MSEPVDNQERHGPSQPLKGKRESYAQARAAGHPATEAFFRAGYLPGAASPRSLESKPDIRARIDYLLLSAAAEAAQETHVTETIPDEITPTWIMEMIAKNMRAMELGQRTSQIGRAITECLTRMGQQLGMWQTPYTPENKGERINPLEHVRAEELFAYIAHEIGYDNAIAIINRVRGPARPPPQTGNGSGGNGHDRPNGATH